MEKHYITGIYHNYLTHQKLDVLCTIFSNIVLYTSNIFYLKQVQYNEYWVRTVDIENLVL